MTLKSEASSRGSGIYLGGGHAFTHWKSGDLERARSIVVQSFKSVHSASAPTAVEADFQALQYLQLLIQGDRLEEATGFFRRLINIRENLKEFYYTLENVLLFLKTYRQLTTLEKSKADIIAALPIWGDDYIDIWESAGAPQFVGPELEEFLSNFQVEFHVFTRSIDRERLLNTPSMRTLAQRAKVRYFNLDVFLGERRTRTLLTMNIAHWASLVSAQRQGAGLLLLFADAFYSANSVSSLGSLIRSGEYDALFTIDLQMAASAWEILENRNRFPDGPAQVHWKDLASIFKENRSVREIAWSVDPITGNVPGWSCRLSYADSEYNELRAVSPQPLYMSAKLLAGLPVRFPMSLDLFMVESAAVALGGTGRMKILNEPAEFLCATVDVTDTGRTAATSTAIDVVDQTLINLADGCLLGPTRRWAFQNPLCLGEKHEDSPLFEIEKRFDAHCDHRSVELNNYLRFFREIVQPAFGGLI
jgi:hypothetical protein